MSKPTYADIARTAGVGTATVERVLNGRGGVRSNTAEKVVLAARQLDWPGRLPDRHLGIIRIEVLLVRPSSSFFTRLAKAFRRIARTLDPAVQVHVTYVDEYDPDAIARHISKSPVRRSGLVVAVPDLPQIHDAVKKVHNSGVPVVQVVVSLFPGMDYIGIDNLGAGRMAGMMMNRLNDRDGRVIAMCHSQLYKDQCNRIRGFSDYMANRSRTSLTFDHVIFGHDDREISANRVEDALRRWPDIVGFYNAGGGNTGALRVLRDRAPDIFFVGHELNEFTEANLKDGIANVIFDQLPEAQARRAIDMMLWRIGLVEGPIDNPPIRFTTTTAENV